MKILRALTMIFFLLDGCIDPLPLNPSADESSVVVDGMISNEPVPWQVRLFMSTALSGDQNLPRMVQRATVWISDDLGGNFYLSETEPGIYVADPEAQGQTGRTYRLHIVTEDGTEFESTPETLVPPGKVDSVYSVYERNAINQTDPTQPQDAITFYVDGRSDALNVDGLLRWRSTATYEILTFPEKRVIRANGEVIPDPLPCSGFVNSNGILKPVDTCSCCNCWVNEYPRNAVVSPAQFAKNNQYRGVAVARIPVDSWRFFRKYHLEVEQLSVSEKVYEFWKRIAAQQQGTGSLFQPNAVKVKGNMRCLSDPEKEVLGIFSAYSITRKSVFVRRPELPVTVPAPDEVTFDCRYVLDNSVNVKPPFW